jgi:ribosomal protein L9
VATAMASKVYYKPGNPAAFSTLQKRQAALKQSSKQKKKTPNQIKAWLEKQDAYTLHRPVRKRFPRNPYNVTN